ncbi:hypothetical protein NQZ68_025461 [Dissostichus eleginoides]|nr:hypothetical protein NQZ68_025461 [Dissostichus eleginoides]
MPPSRLSSRKGPTAFKATLKTVPKRGPTTFEAFLQIVLKRGPTAFEAALQTVLKKGSRCLRGLPQDCPLEQGFPKWGSQNPE